MIEMRKNHVTLSDIGKEFGITKQAVHKMIGNTGSVKVKKEKIRKIDNSISRFFQFVTVQDVESDQCWIWHGAKVSKGYGWFSHLGENTKEGRHSYAHRFSYELFNGPIPEDLQICHSCDNPACVNPSHLWTGTAKDNVHDSMKKGRFKPFGKQYNPKA